MSPGGNGSPAEDAADDGQLDQSWRQVFDFFDLDRSGSISASELQQCLQSLGHKAKIEEVEDMIAQGDIDNDGTIDYPEFVKLMSSQGAMDGLEISRESLKRYFDGLDKDRSGYITAAELRHNLTAVRQHLSDEEVDKLMNRYDLRGVGQLTLPEFEVLVEDLGMKVVDKGVEEHVTEIIKAPPEKKHQHEHGCFDWLAALFTFIPQKQFDLLAALFSAPTPQKQFELLDEPVAISDPELAKALKPLSDAEGKVRLSDVQQAVETWQKYHDITSTDPEDNPALHWESGRQKHGLGEVIYKANHIALVVSDVGRSVAFYSDVIGLQQIRRPDFDRHGAWFTMGNMELHLIKGVPVVHSGKDLIVGHISIETYDIDRVPKILEKLGVPFRQNVSVPKGKMAQGSGTNSTNDSSNIVKQYFLRDPDGYYIEVCNCDVLTKYCLGDVAELAGYDDGAGLNCCEAGVIVNAGLQLAHRARLRQAQIKQISEEMVGADQGYSVEALAERLGCTTPAEAVDEEKMAKLLVRRSVYGDLCQNETEESLREILLAAGNHIPKAMEIMEVRAVRGQVMTPPAFFEQGETKFVPESFKISN